MRIYQEIIGANGCASTCQVLTDLRVVTVDRGFKREDFHGGENEINALDESLRSRFLVVEPTLGRDNNASANGCLAELRNLLGDCTLRTSNEIRDDVRVQQVPRRHWLEFHIVERGQVFIHIGEVLIERVEGIEQGEQATLSNWLDDEAVAFLAYDRLVTL